MPRSSVRSASSMRLFPTGLRFGVAVAFLAALCLAALSGIWSYRTLVLLQSAQQLGVAETGSIRAWMTIQYVATTYNVDEDVLARRLRLPADTDPRIALRTLAEKQGLSPFEYVQAVQAAVAEIAERQQPDSVDAPKGWVTTLGDSLLSAVLIHGYPALAITLFLGAVGAPVPTGLSTMVAGSLASEGYLSWQWLFVLAVCASALGDLVGYGLGRTMGGAFLERRGRWFGYTPANRARVERIFVRWGAVAVLLTRTLASHLSSVVSLLAGVSRFHLVSFLVFTIIGRILWTAAYFGLGYLVGTQLESASGFLANLSVFLISVTVAFGAAAAFVRLRPVRKASLAD